MKKLSFSFLFLFLAFNIYSQCNYSISLSDDYGDGWQGGTITVLINGTAVLTDITLANGTGPENHDFSVTIGDDITTEFIAGDWVQEVGYKILDSDGIVVVDKHGSGGGANAIPPADVTSGTITVVCPSCSAPNSLVANNIDEASADLFWQETGTATIWNLEWGISGFSLGSGTQVNNLTATYYSLSDLSQGTTYEFYVQSHCSLEPSSWAGPFSFSTITPPVSNPSACSLNIPINPGYDNCLDVYIDVNGLYGTQLGTDVLVDKVNIIIEHIDDSQLTFSLTSPNYVTTEISYWHGTGANYGIIDGTCTQYSSFSMAGPDGPLNFASSPFVGEYLPETDFSNWNDNSDPNGMWKLRVCVDPGGEIGHLQYAEIEFEDLAIPTADIIINELDCDQTSDTLEFVELYDGGIGNVPLDDYAVAFYNGSSNQIYKVFDLDGYTTNSNGYFVLGNPAVPNVDLSFPNGSLQDGADAVALYTDNANNLPVGTIVTTTNLADALVYGTGDATDNDLLPLLNTSQTQVDEDELGNKKQHSCSRLPNGSGGLRNTDTYSAAMPTPGTENIGVPRIIWEETEFTEALANNGSIGNTISIELENNKFETVGFLTENTDYSVTNIPIGLNFEIETLTDTTAELRLTGNADSHIESDDISNLNITFLDNVYTIYESSLVINNLQDLSVNFFDTPPATLVWGDDTFYENESTDNGTINTTISIELISETFTSSSGEIFAYIANNTPPGLSMKMIATDASHATILLTGNALNHNLIDNINNLEIIFDDLAFSGGNALNVNNSSKSDISIEYYEFFNTGTEILTYSIPNQDSSFIFNTNDSIFVQVPAGTDLNNLIAEFTLSTGATAFVSSNEQISGTTPNNFESQVTYHVIAEDGITNRNWIIVVSSTTKTVQLPDEKQISIYPNPASTYVQVESKKIDIESYEVYNITGKLIKQSTVHNSKFKILTENWETGIYWIKITTNTTTINKKIIIE